MRVGIGHDTHRLEPGLPLWIGGVRVPSDRGAVGHSDADVLLHAVTDALLGSAALGDIGGWFPDTDPQYSGASSSRFVEAARSELARRGLAVVNLDVTVFVESPRLAEFATEIRTHLATLLETDIEAISFKAKTGEGVGPVGRGEAIGAMAAVLVETVELSESKADADDVFRGSEQETDESR